MFGFKKRTADFDVRELTVTFWFKVEMLNDSRTTSEIKTKIFTGKVVDVEEDCCESVKARHYFDSWCQDAVKRGYYEIDSVWYPVSTLYKLEYAEKEKIITITL
jgi:nickel-dependent lactate racemase